MIKVFEENKKLATFTTILIAIGIFIISSIPSYGIETSNKNNLAIFYHFFAFFFLQLFLLINTTRNSNLTYFLPSILISFLYSVLDELHQYFIPGRFFSYGDILTDLSGILLATIIYYAYKKHTKLNFK